MALGFGTTYGSGAITGATDVVVTPYTAYPSALSISVRYQRNPSTLATSTGALVVKGTTNNQLALFFAGSGATLDLAVAGGGLDLTTSLGNGFGASNYITGGVDGNVHHVLVLYNAGSFASNPTWYLDGVLQTNNVVQHSSGTKNASTQAWEIGNSNPIGASLNGGAFDGIIGDVAVWSVQLSNGLANAKALFNGLDPRAIQPASLVSYVPGADAAARDYIGGPSTVTGTAYQNHLAGIKVLRQRQRTIVDFHVAASALVGSAAGLGSTSGTLVGAGALVATAAGVGSTSGVATATGALSGTSAGLATATAALGGTGAASGTAAGLGSTAGAMIGAGALIATSAGLGTSSAALTGAGTLAGAGAGAGSAAGALTATGALSAAASAVGTASAFLTGLGALVGSATGLGTATAAGSLFRQAAGSAAGLGGASGTLLGIGALVGAGAGLGSTSAAPSSSAALFGSAAAIGSAVGALGGFLGASGSAMGLGSAFATLTGYRIQLAPPCPNLAAAIIPVATVTVTVATMLAVAATVEPPVAFAETVAPMPVLSATVAC